MLSIWEIGCLERARTDKHCKYCEWSSQKCYPVPNNVSPHLQKMFIATPHSNLLSIPSSSVLCMNYLAVGSYNPIVRAKDQPVNQRINIYLITSDCCFGAYANTAEPEECNAVFADIPPPKFNSKEGFASYADFLASFKSRMLAIRVTRLIFKPSNLHFVQTYFNCIQFGNCTLNNCDQRHQTRRGDLCAIHSSEPKTLEA